MNITLSIADGSAMQAYTVLPSGTGPHPGIIVLQEAYGVNGHMRRVSDTLAAEGFVVITPELFHRTAPPGFESPYGDFAAVMPHYQAITLQGLEQDVTACFAWLQAQPGVTGIASMGFCLGGRVAFVANAVLPLAAGVSYYGGSLDQVAHLAPRLSGPHLFAWGGLDKHLPREVRDKVTTAMDEAGRPYVNIVFSNADHAFNCDDRPAYQPDASREAWALSMAFIRNHTDRR